MPLPQTKLREIVIQLLFAKDFAGPFEEELASFVMQTFRLSRSQSREVIGQVRSIWELKELFDPWIEEKTPGYDLHRIGRVELAILRWALFARREEKLPASVIIAEAVRLAIKFSTPEAAKFINGVLGTKSVETTPISA